MVPYSRLRIELGECSSGASSISILLNIRVFSPEPFVLGCALGGLLVSSSSCNVSAPTKRTQRAMVSLFRSRCFPVPIDERSLTATLWMLESEYLRDEVPLMGRSRGSKPAGECNPPPDSKYIFRRLLYAEAAIFELGIIPLKPSGRSVYFLSSAEILCIWGYLRPRTAFLGVITSGKKLSTWNEGEGVLIGSSCSLPTPKMLPLVASFCSPKLRSSFDPSLLV